MIYTALQYVFNICGSGSNFFTYWIPYAGLFIAGYVLGNKAKDVKKVKLLTVLSLSGFAVTAMLNYYMLYATLHNQGFLKATGCLVNYSNDYLSINVIVMSLCAFVLLLHFPYDFIKNIVLHNLIHSVAKASFGIYLIHLIILHILDYKLHLFDHLSILWVLVFVKWLTVFIVSYIATLLFLRIPIIRKLFGVS